MSDRSLLARIFPPWGRRRSRPVHPSIGLPADAPDKLETPNGSFVRVLPESEHIPLYGTGRTMGRIIVCLVIAFFVFVAVINALGFILPEFAVSNEATATFLISAFIGDFLLLLVPVILLVLFEPRYRSTSMPKLLSWRSSRLFGPGDVSGIMSFLHGDTWRADKETVDDFALFRIGEGFLEFESSRAQVRIAAEDLSIFVPEEGSFLLVQARFGDLRWSVVAKYIEFFEWRRPLDRYASWRRYSHFADMILARVGTVNAAVTGTGDTKPRPREWEPSTVHVGDSTIRVSRDGFDVASHGGHQFFLGWDEIDRVRWRESAKLVISGAGRKVVIPQSALNAGQLECIKKRLVHFDLSVRYPGAFSSLVWCFLLSGNAALIGKTMENRGPIKHLIISLVVLLVVGIFGGRLLSKRGKTRCYKRKTLKTGR
jgi:hypothetical protein